MFKVISTLITKRGNSSKMHKHLTSLHAVHLHGCNVFDILISDGDDSQSGTNENPMRNDNRYR